ncbi:FtsX-like permease family protein, partial [bacterium]|nr:FtsX-like permease family protein [bacterium]
QILVKGYDAESLDTIESEIEELLIKRHALSKTQPKDFEIRNSAEFQERMKSTVETFAILLASIASVSLLVGGIGIMNIMLVSVTERTKEIGIRMAIGANAKDIRQQFLIESFLLSVSGGLAGVALGVGITVFLNFVLDDMNTKISLFSIFLSLGFSGLVGVIFGYYPAHKASLLKPIDALRYE